MNTHRFDSYSSAEPGLDLQPWDHSLRLPIHQNLFKASPDDPKTMAQRQELSLVTPGYLFLNSQGAGEHQEDNGDMDRSKRYSSKPNSLDLTFHLLREFLGMAKAEKMAQKAESNRLFMESIGK
ncbi:corticoliberin-like [Hemiscyllium ocellatum]|uniref:corticoliberin-like n=1 Tax=Hemiscyllium ocellatum TaxID=170820 RepID=UPI002965D235|nr:corticoliberin-like [Hemiscyllium ocellatum]